MTDRPMIFGAPTVRALLAGRKTQTRRVLKPQPPTGCDEVQRHPGYTEEWIAYHRREPQCMFHVPYAPGDRLWVRETWTPETDFNLGYEPPHNDGRPIRWEEHPECGRWWTQPHYRATDGPACRWRSPIHMPRWASRLTLTVKDVRVQRLHEISGEDAIAEGVEIPRCGCEFCSSSSAMCPADASEACMALAELWNSIHGPDAWELNPWVCAITFTVRHGNIDQ